MRKAVLAAFAAVFLGGCVVSDNPFPEANKDVEGGRALVGTWTQIGAQPESSAQVFNVADRGGWFQADSFVNGNPYSSYTFSAYRSGGETFLALQYQGRGPYTLVRYVLEGQDLTFYVLPEQTVVEATSSGRIASRIDDEGGDVLTAAPESVLAFFGGRPLTDFRVNARYRKTG